VITLNNALDGVDYTEYMYGEMSSAHRKKEKSIPIPLTRS